MRLTEIEQRLNQIREEISTEGITAEKLNELQSEADALIEERKALIENANSRAALLKRIADGAGTTRRTFSEPTPETEQRVGTTDNETTNTLEYRRAFMAYVLRNTPMPAEFRSNEVTSTTEAGAAIPQTVLDQIIDRLDSVGMILPLVTHTAYRGGLSIPVASAKPTASWVNEGAGSDTQKIPTGSVVFSYHKLRCAVALTLEVETMALSAFESLLINNISKAMIKTLEQAIISGNGTGKPKGILAETPVTGHTISVVTPSIADLFAAEAALPLAYEGGAVYCMSKKTFMDYYGLLDDNGQPIGRINYGINGKPERMLLGRPVICCDYVTSFSAEIDDDTPFAFIFDFKDYILNTNYQISIRKYEDNDNDNMVTKAIMLVDGKVIDKNSLVVLQKASTPAAPQNTPI